MTMQVIIGCLLLLAGILGFVLYLALGIFRVSVLDRRDHRKEELAFLSRSAKPQQTVFLGDSITHYCPVEEIYAQYTEKTGLRVYNRGIASETTADALKRLDSNVLALDPANLVVLLGCNDIGKKITAAQTVSNIEQIIVKAREKNPDMHIILQAVYPIRERVRSLPARILMEGCTREKIKVLNTELEAMAKRQRVTFVNLTDTLADNSGQLKQEFTQDGLHVNEKAYQQIAAKVIPLLEEDHGKT